MRFASLGSGSRGNGTLIEHASTCILLDCGFSVRETEKRLARLGKTADELSAIVITHEHGDHINGVGALARKFKLPVWATSGTLAADRLGSVADVRVINSHLAFTLGDFQVQPFPVPHDAREPCQFVFHADDRRLGVLTDVGSITVHIVEQLSGCDTLILECNHDKVLLDTGQYPPSLKRRVGGIQGHLSNAQAEDLLRRLETGNLKQLVAAHLSEKHNTPALARAAVVAALGCEADWVIVADQDAGLDWHEV